MLVLKTIKSLFSKPKKVLVKFGQVRPGQRFWNDAFDDDELVEHIRLYEDDDNWNCVELQEGRLCYMTDEVEVLVIVP